MLPKVKFLNSWKQRSPMLKMVLNEQHQSMWMMWKSKQQGKMRWHCDCFVKCNLFVKKSITTDCLPSRCLFSKHKQFQDECCQVHNHFQNTTECSNTVQSNENIVLFVSIDKTKNQNLDDFMNVFCQQQCLVNHCGSRMWITTKEQQSKFLVMNNAGKNLQMVSIGSACWPSISWMQVCQILLLCSRSGAKL